MSPKVVVVTGSNRGIGLALAVQFSKQGDIVIATVRSKANAGTLASLPNVTLVELDADDIATVDSAVAEIEEIAPEGIDELWNLMEESRNVQHWSEDGLSPHILAPDMQRIFLVNVTTPTYLASKLLPQLEKRKTKKIVFVSSCNASFDYSKSSAGHLTKAEAPFIYGASKSALNMSAWYFHNQLNSSGFTIVPIHPGLVVTDMNPFGAISSEESAKKMLDTVDALSAKDEFFLRNYDGSVLAW
ncbi:hypothetical protein V1523DRAFT_429016 [Lipomyces doorenjongii]